MSFCANCIDGPGIVRRTIIAPSGRPVIALLCLRCARHPLHGPEGFSHRASALPPSSARLPACDEQDEEERIADRVAMLAREEP